MTIVNEQAGSQREIMTRAKSVCAGIALTLITCIVALADDAGAESNAAQSGFSAEQLAAGSLAAFPEGTFDSVASYSGDPGANAILANCWVLPVSSNSDAVDNDVQCLMADPNQSKLFLEEVLKIARSASIQQAVVNKEERVAKLHFRVLLTRFGDKSQVEYFPNWGHDADKYEYKYDAPQRLEYWPKRPASKTCGRSRIMSLVTIGVDSKIQDGVELQVDSGKPSRKCKRALEEYLSGSYFLPGRKGEELIEARHVELWGNWE